MRFPVKKYKLIYADPPWKYHDKLNITGGGAESHYPCMTPTAISGLPVESISNDDSILLIWTTYPQLEMVFPVIRAWGFTYKTVAFTWIKTNTDKSIFMGMGHYTRANPEICLLAKRGKGIQRIDNTIMGVHFHKRLAHSKKPPMFRCLIEDLYGEVPRIELFARERVFGWDAWGNEV